MPSVFTCFVQTESPTCRVPLTFLLAVQIWELFNFNLSINILMYHVFILRLFQNDWKVNESLAYNIHSPLMLLAKRDSISSIPVTLTLNATANQVKLGQPKGAFSDYVMDSVRVGITLRQWLCDGQCSGGYYVTLCDGHCSGGYYVTLCDGQCSGGYYVTLCDGQCSGGYYVMWWTVLGWVLRYVMDSARVGITLRYVMDSKRISNSILHCY